MEDTKTAKRNEILSKLTETLSIMNSNRNSIRDMQQRTKDLGDRIRSLQSDLSMVCTHEYGCKYLQRVSPSKEVYMRSCNFCKLQVYASELPEDANIKIRSIQF